MIIGILALFRAHAGSLKNLQQLLGCWQTDGTFDRHRFIFYASPETVERLTNCLPTNAVVRALVPPGGGWRARLLAEHYRLPKVLQQDGVDVLYSPANTLPFRCGVPTVVNFNNIDPFCPLARGWWRTRSGWSDAFRRLVLRGLVWQAAHCARGIITNSAYYRDLLVRRYRIPIERFTVIERACPLPEKASGEQVTQVLRACDLTPPFVLAVHHLYPYKNIEALLAAFRVALSRLSTNREIVLAVVGGCYLPGYRERLEQVARERGVDTRVRFLGALPPDQVSVLMDVASAFAFSSSCENCPNALLEAMAHGCAIVTSSNPPMPEFVGDAALIADPLDPEKFGESLASVLDTPELAVSLRGRALKRAMQYSSVKQMASRTLEVIVTTAPSQSTPHSPRESFGRRGGGNKGCIS